MAKYAVKIIETLCKEIIVEADNKNSAIDSIQDKYENYKIVLSNTEHFHDVEFYAHKIN